MLPTTPGGARRRTFLSAAQCDRRRRALGRETPFLLETLQLQINIKNIINIKPDRFLENFYVFNPAAERIVVILVPTSAVGTLHITPATL